MEVHVWKERSGYENNAFVSKYMCKLKFNAFDKIAFTKV